jgi:hypothetical protein
VLGEDAVDEVLVARNRHCCSLGADVWDECARTGPSGSGTDPHRSFCKSSAGSGAKTRIEGGNQ